MGGIPYLGSSVVVFWVNRLGVLGVFILERRREYLSGLVVLGMNLSHPWCDVGTFAVRPASRLVSVIRLDAR